MTALLSVQDLEMRFGDRLIQRNVSFEVQPKMIFAIMGGSGCGKSTLLKHLAGLIPPAGGHIQYGGALNDNDDASQAGDPDKPKFGMLFQSAALWSSMTVLENVSLPLSMYAKGKMNAKDRTAKAHEVLSWVGMDKFADFHPADLSGGMKKRVGLARAVVAEPPLLYLDEPSAGLDPISSRRLDDLILEIRDRTKAAVVFVSHELPSLMAIADDGIFLDAESKEPIAHGSPRSLVDSCEHPTVRAFLHREVPADMAQADEAADNEEWTA